MYHARDLAKLVHLLACAVLVGCSSSGSPGAAEDEMKRCMTACEDQKERDKIVIAWSTFRELEQPIDRITQARREASGQLGQNKELFASHLTHLPAAKIVERRTIPGATQFLLYPTRENHALMATLVLRDGAWKLYHTAWESIYYEGSAEFFVLDNDTRGELGTEFLEAIQRKPPMERETFIEAHKRKTITISGTVNEVWPERIPVGGANFVVDDMVVAGGGNWFFYVDSPDAPDLEIQVDLDLYVFASSKCVGEGKEGVATSKYLDNSTEVVKPGQTLTVTGIVWVGRGNRLWIVSSRINKSGTPGANVERNRPASE